MATNDPDDISMLPAKPAATEVLHAYQLCRSKLVTANRSRSALLAHDRRRRALIDQLQSELNELEDSLREETATRIKVHDLNEKVARIVKELEEGLDETAAIIGEKGKGGLTGWVVRIARLLPIVQRLRGVKTAARQLLGRQEHEPAVLALRAEELEQAELFDPQDLQPPRDQAHEQEPVRDDFGPLLLTSLDYAYGVLLLSQNNRPIPDGLAVVSDSPWLPGQNLLVPKEPEDPDYAPIESGFMALEAEGVLIAELRSWLTQGLLPFANDPRLDKPRLVQNLAAGGVTHVLVREEKAEAFQDMVGGTAFELDGDHWLGFVLTTDEANGLGRFLNRKATPRQSLGPRLSNRGGVPLADGRGYLATGLGLPLLALPAEIAVEEVQLQCADETVLPYQAVKDDDPEASRSTWQPLPLDRRRPTLPAGTACFTARLTDGSTLERSIQLADQVWQVRFQRLQPLAYREDWGMALGALALPWFEPPGHVPSHEALQWARRRLNQGDVLVNHLFEQQMLESLSALFQRLPSIRRRDFFQLYGQLRNKPDEWPGFPDAVLRGWCEGGWIEEGLEGGNGRWRIQPVDPRLVRLAEGYGQLVGLLSSRGLVALIATAHELGIRVEAVLPTCADMPRGWRFRGSVDQLGIAAGLPVVDLADWSPDPRKHSWLLDKALASDTPPWPTGLTGRRMGVAVCGKRGLDYHWKTIQPLPAGHRASIQLRIEAETTLYGKRRWHSHDPIRGVDFVSCHRNRVALHALEVATDGLWPFGFTDLQTGQIDRLYDAEAYLPLAIGRYAAATGPKMPGPTRLKPADHTYRYWVDRAFRSFQYSSQFLPLTVIDDAA
jgi:hypothetical protein